MKTQKTKKSLKFRSKCQKRGIQVIGEWKPVSLDPSLFADEKLDEIICFEELTDYKLVKTSNELKTKGLKRKHEVDDDDDEEEQRDAEDDENIVKSKKRKKRKDRSKQAKGRTEVEQRDESFGQEDPEDIDENINSEGDDTEEIVQVKPKQQTKSSKKKKKRKVKTKILSSQEETPLPKSSKKIKNWASDGIAGSSGKNADVSAWRNLCVPKPVLQALSYLGFCAPTPIQALVLPSAIRDQMDILGAAETGSGKTLAFAIPMIHSILEWQKAQEAGSGDEESEQVEKEDTLVCNEQDEPEVADLEVDAGTKDESRREEDDDGSLPLGCVKVVKDVDVNFDPAPPSKSITWDKKRPLLGLVVAPTRELAVQVKHHIDAVAKFTGIKTAMIVGGMAPQKQERVLNQRPEIVIATPGRLWELIRERHSHLCNLRKLR
ncbi:hypothetical protein FKM82_022450 [Ascaphus truei]